VFGSEESWSILQYVSLSLALFSHPTRKSELMMETFFVVCTDVQMTIMQNLQYTEHLSEPMAELITVFTKEFDNDILGDSQLNRISFLSLTVR